MKKELAHKDLRIVHILPHTIEDFIVEGQYDSFEHHSITFISRVSTSFGMRNESVTQELWVLTKKPEAFSVMHSSGVFIRFFPLSNHLPLPLEWSTTLLAAVRNDNSTLPTVWHLHSYYLVMNDVLSCVLWRAKKPFVLHYRGGGPSFTLKAFWYTLYHYCLVFPFTMRMAQKVLVQNKDEIKRLQKVSRIPQRNIVYIPNTVDGIPRFNPSPQLDGRFVILLAGRMQKYFRNKKNKTLLETIVAQYPQVSLSIVGVQTAIPELDCLQDSFPNQVTIYPWISKHELRQLFVTSTCLLHLNDKGEGSPMVVIEAQSHAVPVIAYDIEGVRDVIDHGSNGFLCTSPKDIVSAVDLLVYNQALVESMRLAAVEKIQKEFLTKQYFTTIVSVYRSCN